MPDRDPRAAAAEADFRALLDEGGLPEPDEVLEEDPGELVFLFHAPRVAIVVEYAEDRGGAGYPPWPPPPVKG